MKNKSPHFLQENIKQISHMYNPPVELIKKQYACDCFWFKKL